MGSCAGWSDKPTETETVDETKGGQHERQGAVAEKDPVELIQKVADSMGGNVNEVVVLPDGSGFATASWPLPKTHWIYAEGRDETPMPFRIGLGDERTRLAQRIKDAAQVAIRRTTMNGQQMDFDPDALVQNLVVCMLGYWTSDGLSHT